MKRKYLLLQILVTTLTVSAFLPVEESFEGTIRYETSTKGNIPTTVADKLSKYYDVSFKGSDLKLVGDGPTKGQIFLKKKLSKMLILRADQKNIYALDFNDPRIPPTPVKSHVIKTKDVATVAGFACDKYQIQYQNNIKLNVWTTSKINIAAWGDATVFGGFLKLPAQVVGFPLMLEIVSPDFTITGTAVEVKGGVLDARLFELPAEIPVKKL